MENYGITMISLLITIIILVLLTAVAIKTIMGENGIIKVATDSAEDHEVISYAEQINYVVNSEIVSKSTIGQTATTENICDILNEQDWIKRAVINVNANTEIGDITAQVVDGYIYQIYYNPFYGKINVDYIGEDWEKACDLTLTAHYEKSVTSIFAIAEDQKHGVNKIELIYKQNIVGNINRPNGEQKFDISKIRKWLV